MAYRAGEKLKDERTGLTHDFTRKEGVVYTEIISNLDTELTEANSGIWQKNQKTEKMPEPQRMGDCFT
jgi:hypothetical protein